MVTTETIDQQPLCFRSEEQMIFLRRSHWPCSTVTLLGDTILFLQPDFIAWKIFLTPPAFLLWKTDLRAAQLLPSVTWCHRQTTTQPPQTRGTANATVTLHAKTFPMLPFQQWQESGLKSHSWAGHRPDILCWPQLTFPFEEAVPQQQSSRVVPAAPASHPDLAHQLLFSSCPESCKDEPNQSFWFAPPCPLVQTEYKNYCRIPFLTCKALSHIPSGVKHSSPAPPPTKEIFLLDQISGRNSSLWGWSGTGIGFPEKLWMPHHL